MSAALPAPDAAQSLRGEGFLKKRASIAALAKAAGSLDMEIRRLFWRAKGEKKLLAELVEACEAQMTY